MDLSELGPEQGTDDHWSRGQFRTSTRRDKTHICTQAKIGREMREKSTVKRTRFRTQNQTPRRTDRRTDGDSRHSEQTEHERARNRETESASFERNLRRTWSIPCSTGATPFRPHASEQGELRQQQHHAQPTHRSSSSQLHHAQTSGFPNSE